MRKTIPEQKIVICDFCGNQLLTNQNTGDQLAGVRFTIKKRVFVGLCGKYDRSVDLCTNCFKKLTGKDYTYDWKSKDEGM